MLRFASPFGKPPPRCASAAVALATVAALSAPAQANVILTLTDIQAFYNLPPGEPPTPRAGVPLVIELTDAAVADGVFTLGCPCLVDDPRAPYTGEADGFVRINAFTPSYHPGNLNIALTFSPDLSAVFGEVRINQMLGPSEYALYGTITQNAFSGWIATESQQFFCAVERRDCPQTGTIVITRTTVPEPASLALLGLGIAGLGAVRRRPRRAATTTQRLSWAGAGGADLAGSAPRSHGESLRQLRRLPTVPDGL